MLPSATRKPDTNPMVNHKYGNTIVMVTHNDAIKDMADRVVKLRDGMIRRNYQNEQKIPAADLEW